MRERKKEIIEKKNQKERNKKKIKVILKNTLSELRGSCGPVIVIRPLVSVIIRFEWPIFVESQILCLVICQLCEVGIK